MSTSTLKPRPPFSSLPLRKNDPPFSAWGLYGPDDELGSLNLLTKECVIEATKEIKTGERIGLNLPLTIPHPPSHNRLPFTHKVTHKSPRNVHDDVIEMNTQASHYREITSGAMLTIVKVFHPMGWFPALWIPRFK